MSNSSPKCSAARSQIPVAILGHTIKKGFFVALATAVATYVFPLPITDKSSALREDSSNPDRCSAELRWYGLRHESISGLISVDVMGHRGRRVTGNAVHVSAPAGKAFIFFRANVMRHGDRNLFG